MFEKGNFIYSFASEWLLLVEKAQPIGPKVNATFLPERDSRGSEFWAEWSKLRSLKERLYQVATELYRIPRKRNFFSLNLGHCVNYGNSSYHRSQHR